MVLVLLQVGAAKFVAKKDGARYHDVYEVMLIPTLDGGFDVQIAPVGSATFLHPALLAEFELRPESPYYEAYQEGVEHVNQLERSRNRAASKEPKE